MLLFLLIVFLLAPVTHSLNQEGLYLLRAKDGLDDPDGALSSWNPRDDTPCNWLRITCDPVTHQVTAVNLSSTSVAGPFPTFLCRLPNLSSISLSNNNINSSLTADIAACRSLQYLDLDQNLLLGSLPSSLPELPNLRHLNLSGNNFSGDIPASFGAFRKLETLVLTGNLLNGTIPGFLGNITSLKNLHLAYNPFTPGRLSMELGNLTGLEDLWLSSCNLVGEIPASIGWLGSLTNLDLSNNGLSGPIPSSFTRLTSVIQIELFGNSLSGKFPAGMSNMTSLRRFDASSNKIGGTISAELCGLPLESLVMQNNQLSGPLPDSIALSPNLHDLRIFNNRLSGSIPSDLGKNSPLMTLDVSQNNFSGEIPANLCSRGALGQLLMIGNMLTGKIPSSLGECRSLTRVRLKNNLLSGEVPAKFWGLPHVWLLELAENSLSGHVSSMISNAFNLSSLLISKNQFSGSIPPEVGLLSNLGEFSGSDNKFSGEIPGTLVNLAHLVKLDLSGNELSGEIPVGVESWKKLNELDLANNKLSGEIPDKFGNLPVLNYLDLSRNYFSGKVPPELQNLKLNSLNLSYNRLSGDLPPFFAKEIYRSSFVGNPGLCDVVDGLCPSNVTSNNWGSVWILRLIFVLAGVVLVGGVVWFYFRYQNIRKPKKGLSISKWRSFHKLGFSELEIVDCLNEDNVIGTGASGKVYKVVLSNGEAVAVKKLWGRSKIEDAIVKSEKDGFEVEVDTLGNIRHKNIVRLWCCCNTGDCKLLVYEYMPNGSLGDLLHSSKGSLLDWPVRYKIALDAAEGLSYLHHDCVPPIVHRDVKSNNILLGAEFGAKVADFGVAKVFREVSEGEESMSIIAGSYGYIAPEYGYTLRVNEKSDIYSFGVVILELVTGRLPIDPEYGEKDLVKWVCTTLDQKGVDHVIDPKLDSTYMDDICKVLNIGLSCASPLPISRPSMRRVVKMLQEVCAEIKPKVAKKDGILSPFYYEDGCDQRSLV